MEFFPYEPFDNNQAQKKVWDSIKEAFKDDPGVAYYRYPIFTRSGRLNREPDILILHRELGLWVIECKGCKIDNILSIQGHEWRMNNWYSEIETPVAQAENQMYAVKNKLTDCEETRGLVSFNFRVALPFISKQEWQTKGFHDLPSTQGVVLLADNLTPKAFKNKITESAQDNPQKIMSDKQWENVKGVLGGTLTAKPPRPVSTGTAANNPIRVISAIESQLKKLDETQQRIAFEVPPGPQRIRGLAGTGKTVLLAKRAAKIHFVHPDWQIAFIFFTQALYEQITELIGLYYREMTGGEEPDWRKIHILHSWGARDRAGFYRSLAMRCGATYRDLNRARAELKSGSPSSLFEYVCNCFEQEVPNPPTLYDVALIDEGQDLPPSFYRMVRGTLSDSKRLYWAYDEAQGIGSLIVPEPVTIFGLTQDGKRVVDLGGPNPDGTITPPTYSNGIPRNWVMRRCYRTPRLLLMTAHAINMGLFRYPKPLQGVTTKLHWDRLGYEATGDFRRIGSSIKITRPAKYSPHPIDQEDFKLHDALGSPLVIQTFATEEEEIDWIAEQVANDIKLGFHPWDIMITGPTGHNESQGPPWDRKNAYFPKLKLALEQHGVPSLIAGVDTSKDIFRMDGYVTISTIFRAKGNEAWKIYACRFQYATRPLEFRKDTEIHKRNEAFVALTRARIWCVVTGLEGESLIFNELQKAKQQYPNFTFPAFNKNSLGRIYDKEEGEDTDAEEVNVS
ncbi:NERD domain-containing protein [Iningainema tapete]|uniref:NERD domain-containing protein n=1 Tax=Iningainema tapete BLCC-T55 TaxID=2748662 RepID=A0A8J6XIL9_9CYAN|nr:nuclease-related domain-containing DEAD/DEAH box helicase [Iningainema tapete]MBD2771396.1 NERD domain-containing protein [Iningainema tapete BLCC-T55]